LKIKRKGTQRGSDKKREKEDLNLPGGRRRTGIKITVKTIHRRPGLLLPKKKREKSNKGDHVWEGAAKTPPKKTRKKVGHLIKKRKEKGKCIKRGGKVFMGKKPQKICPRIKDTRSLHSRKERNPKNNRKRKNIHGTRGKGNHQVMILGKGETEEKFLGKREKKLNGAGQGNGRQGADVGPKSKGKEKNRCGFR